MRDRMSTANGYRYVLRSAGEEILLSPFGSKAMGYALQIVQAEMNAARLRTFVRANHF